MMRLNGTPLRMRGGREISYAGMMHVLQQESRSVLKDNENLAARMPWQS